MAELSHNAYTLRIHGSQRTVIWEANLLQHWFSFGSFDAELRTWNTVFRPGPQEKASWHSVVVIRKPERDTPVIEREEKGLVVGCSENDIERNVVNLKGKHIAI